jgi:multidrug efflux system outer membrane protein
VSRLLLFLGLAAMLVAGGCKLTPDYERPELDLPEAWRGESTPGEPIANLPWWEIYRDETLSELISTALAQNQNLAIAMARMEEATYLVTFTRADQFPFLDVFGSAGRGRQSREVNPLAGTNSNFSLGANLSFEVDLWRRYARATEAARADLLSTEAAYRNVTISLVGSVANTYLLLRDLDRRLEVSIETAEGRRDRLAIVSARFEKGTEAQIDVNQAEVQLAIAEAAIAEFTRLVARTEHALRVLIGEYPGPIKRGPQLELGAWSLSVPAGLPSELLQRRPDIVAAEQRLVAETAKIGVAQALRFPSLSLTAKVSAVAEDLTDLNSTDAGEWNVAAGIFQPIFNSGRLKAQMKAQRARAEQAQHAYVGTIQNAFREVENSLVSVQATRAEYDARRRQMEASTSVVRLSRARYDSGVVDYLEVLDSERTLFEAQLEESATRRAALASFVDLYKALGGGWIEPEESSEEEVEEAPEGDTIESSEEAPEGDTIESSEEAPEGDTVESGEAGGESVPAD